MIFLWFESIKPKRKARSNGIFHKLERLDVCFIITVSKAVFHLILMADSLTTFGVILINHEKGPVLIYLHFCGSFTKTDLTCKQYVSMPKTTAAIIKLTLSGHSMNPARIPTHSLLFNCMLSTIHRMIVGLHLAKMHQSKNTSARVKSKWTCFSSEVFVMNDFILARGSRGGILAYKFLNIIYPL